MHVDSILIYRRVQSSGQLVAERQFVVVSLAEIIRSWWNHPRIAKLLRYGWEYDSKDLQYDVQDGDLWAEFAAQHTVHDLAWSLCNDGMEVNGAHAQKYSVVHCK